MRALLLAGLLAVAAAAAPPPKCPQGFYYATGFTPANSFDQYADLRYYNRGNPYFTAAARQKCSKFPFFAHDLNNFGARFTRLCLDSKDNAIYSFRTPNPCDGDKQVNGTMYLGARPSRCAKSQLEPVVQLWEQAAVSFNPARQAPLRCPRNYDKAVLPRDQALLKTFVSAYFTISPFISKLIERYKHYYYCDDAFRYIGYTDFTGCILKPGQPDDYAQVVAHSKIVFQCYAPPNGAGLTTPIRTIGLTVKGDYSMQCKREVKLTWK